MRLGSVLKALLALAIVAAPSVRDACFFMCQMPSHVSAASAPSCHHAATGTGVHLQAPGAPCEHGSGPHENRISAREESQRGWRDADRDGALAIHHVAPRAIDLSWHDPSPTPSPQPLAPSPCIEVPLRI